MYIILVKMFLCGSRPLNLPAPLCQVDWFCPPDILTQKSGLSAEKAIDPISVTGGTNVVVKLCAGTKEE